MRAFTINQLATRARERADMVNSGFVTPDELRGYLSASYAELYDLLVSSGLFYFTPGIQTIAANGSELYALPSDYYGTLRVDYQQSGNYWIPLFEYMEAERAEYESYGAVNGQAECYAIHGANISLLPAPTSGSYRHRYIPAPIDLATGDPDVVTVDGVSGWEEFVIVDAARKMLAKEESSTVSVERDLERLRARIDEAALNRAWDSPRRIVDTAGQVPNAADWWFSAGTAD